MRLRSGMRNDRDEPATKPAGKAVFRGFMRAWSFRGSSVLLALVIGGGCGSGACKSAVDGLAGRGGGGLRDKAVAALRAAMHDAPRWVKVHAAESLLALGDPRDIVSVFQRELQTAGGQPEYRIGIWRVLARASADDRERQQWIRRIVDVFMNRAAPDRNHAAETLAKLRYVASADVHDELARVAAQQAGPFSVNAQWVLANGGKPEAERPLLEFLSSDRSEVRLNTAYALRHLPNLSSTSRQALFAAADGEPPDSPTKTYLVSAAAVQAGPEEGRRWIPSLVHLARTGKPDVVYEACMALASVGTYEEVPLLAEMLSATDPDIRVAAAHAILRIGRRDRRVATSEPPPGSPGGPVRRRP